MIVAMNESYVVLYAFA